MTGRPQPLAVGLLQPADDASPAEHKQARIALVLHAADEGYALVETYETGGNPVRRDAAYAALEARVLRLDVRAVVCSGRVDVERVGDLARRAHTAVIATD